MFSKIILTLAVILGAYAVIRARMGRSGETAGSAPPPRPLVPAKTLRVIAFALVACMVAGSLTWLYLDWEDGNQIVTVEIINANTGAVTTYAARRRDVRGRQFITLDGHPVSLADVDRMVLRGKR